MNPNPTTRKPRNIGFDYLVATLTISAHPDAGSPTTVIGLALRSQPTLRSIAAMLLSDDEERWIPVFKTLAFQVFRSEGGLRYYVPNDDEALMEHGELRLTPS